jgi:hypothetical protein
MDSKDNIELWEKLTTDNEFLLEWLELGGDPNMVKNSNNNSKSLLWSATWNRNFVGVRLLLQYGANPNFGGVISNNDWHSRDYPEVTPLMVAVKDRDIDMVKLLLDGVEKKDGNGINKADIKYVAARWGNILHYLTGSFGNSIYGRYSKFTRGTMDEILMLLLEYGANPYEKAPTIWYGRAGKGASEMFKNTKRLYEATPIENAINYGHPGAARLMEAWKRRLERIKNEQVLSFMKSIISTGGPTSELDELSEIGEKINFYRSNMRTSPNISMREREEDIIEDSEEEYEYDANGYDIDGYDANGYDVDGYDVDGYDIDGYDVNGYDIDGYDVDGYDANGYDVDNYDIDGIKKQSAGYKNKRKLTYKRKKYYI